MQLCLDKSDIPAHLLKYFKPKHVLKPKDLVGIPWRVAFALQADGWYLRSDIIWAKPNPMPENVTDRPTKSHEYIFLLTKKQKYFYDAEAVKENSNWDGKSGNKNYRGYEGREGTTMNTLNRFNGARNKRTVWTVSTQPYPEAHFATFPPKLIEPCILAGTSPRVCEICGAPWERIIKRTGHINKREPAHVPNNAPTKTDSTGWRPTTIATDNWQPTCACENEGTGRCIVLDPFAGSGTTLWVAEHYGRDSIGIELSEEYVKLIYKRMDNMQLSIYNIGK